MAKALENHIADLICCEGRLENMRKRIEMDKCANRTEHLELARKIIAAIKDRLED